jgi:N-acetylglucosaminyl-diphospho-decaprenol L-rhamnosyltransferase
MDMSICILTHSQPALLPPCLCACLAEIERSGLSSEILIIDNASSDAYPQKLLGLSPLIQIIRNEENLGFSAANNKAIRVSRGRYVLILNDDALLNEGSLRLMFDRLESSPRVAAVGPKFVNADGSLQRGFSNARFPRLRHIVCQILMLERLLERNAWTREAFTVYRNPEESGETEHLAGACIMARREALEAIGLFDESFYYFAEDLDLCYRLRKARWGVVYLAEARVTHYGSASFSKVSQSERNAIYFKSLLHYFKKHSIPAKYILSRLTLELVLSLGMLERALLGIMRRRLTYEEVKHKARANLSLLRWVFRVDTGRGISNGKGQVRKGEWGQKPT